MQGVVIHTMVGNLPGTITVFNEPSFQASTHFGIDQKGHIHQFGPIGKGWFASAQLVEMLSAFAGFPLQVTDSVSGRDYGTQVMAHQ